MTKTLRGLVNSNRNKNVKKAVDPLSNLNNQKVNDKPKTKIVKKAKKHTRLNKPLFITNLKINNIQRNYLKAISDLGHSASQKDSLQFLIEKYVKSLDNKDRKALMHIVNDYNRFDHLRRKNKK